MSLNDKLDSVVLKRNDESIILQADDDDYAPPPRPKREDDVEMDITPMIDITFLLLIFFLVSSRPDNQTAIHLPRAQHGNAVSQRFSAVISVGEGGADQAPVYKGDGKIEKNLVATDPEARTQELVDYVETEMRVNNKTEVVIKGDRGILCGQMEGVLQSVSKVEGIEKINLGVLESH